jgi:hypothetical protein
MGQKICYLLFIFLFIFGNSRKTLAAGGTTKPWAATISLGYTTQDFNGDETAAFTKIQHYLIDMKFQWHKKWYTLGFAYSTIPAVNISSFLLSTGETGQYKLSFNQIFLFIGATYKLMSMNLLFGSESTQWVGTPIMILKQTPHSVTGLEISYNAYKTKNFDFPIWLRYLNKPQRNMVFQNYTNDTIIVDSGVELALAGGAKIDF